MKTLLLSLLLTAASMAAEPLAPILLWPTGSPGSEGKSADDVVLTALNGDQRVVLVDKPNITAYFPPKEKATGAAIIIAPGGGHREINITFEGKYLADWLNERGIAAFILRYRLSNLPGSTYTVDGHSVPDLQRAIRLVRSRATEWNLDPAKLGVMGFSAGGEVCAMASMNFSAGKPDAEDPLDRLSDRPDFQVLIYPGRSARIVPSKESPPAFLAASANDRADISEGLTKVYLDFKHAGVPVELHLYADSGHGFGFRGKYKSPADGWVDRLQEWMVDRKFTTGVR